MIWLTDSALRYAVDLCLEIDDYQANIYIIRQSDCDDVKLKMKSFTKNKHGTIYNNALNWHADFDNGSVIRILRADNNARGYRCNLAIVAGNVSRTMIDEIIRPYEMDQRPDIIHRTEELVNGETHQATQTFQEGGYVHHDEPFTRIIGDDTPEMVGTVAHATTDTNHITPEMNDTQTWMIDAAVNAHNITTGFLNTDDLRTQINNIVADAIQDRLTIAATDLANTHTITAQAYTPLTWEIRR